MSIEIKEISGKKELKTFFEFEQNHYKDNPYHVPPLIFDEMNTFDSNKNPVFDFCECVHYMAYRDGKPVGRKARLRSHRTNEKFKEKNARFG